MCIRDRVGIAIRDELLSRFDVLAGEADAAFSEQQMHLEFSPGQTPSPISKDNEALTTLQLFRLLKIIA